MKASVNRSRKRGQNSMRNEEYDYFKISCDNREEDSFSKYCESILNKMSIQNEKFPSENGSFSDTKESFLQCGSVQNNTGKDLDTEMSHKIRHIKDSTVFFSKKDETKTRINVENWKGSQNFLSNRKQKRRIKSEKMVPQEQRIKTQESNSDQISPDQNKRFSDCFVKYRSISKDTKKLSIQNSFVIENR